MTKDVRPQDFPSIPSYIVGTVGEEFYRQMKKLALPVAFGLVKLAAFTLAANSASAALYPTDEGLVNFSLRDFIQSVPECNISFPGGCNAVTGDNIGQHPGVSNEIMPSEYFIGLFQKPLRGKLVLWETTATLSAGPPGSSGPGPFVLLGNWNGQQFTSVGDMKEALYTNTGFPGIVPDLVISASTLPLSHFNLGDCINIGGCDNLNAIRISHNPNGHNQVTATASVPEPLTILGAATAASFGAFFKREVNKKKKGKKGSKEA